LVEGAAGKALLAIGFGLQLAAVFMRA
jgi:hypothetical protein